MGKKVSDKWVVPLCNTHHRALHGAGEERLWWKERNIEPIVDAERLWQANRDGRRAGFSIRSRESNSAKTSPERDTASMR